MKFVLRWSSVSDVVGTILILISIGWQISFMEKSQKSAQDSHYYCINQKLDRIWNYTGEIGQEILKDHPNIIGTDYGNSNTGWYNLYENTKKVSKQSEFFNSIRGCLFFLGSILVSIGRIGTNKQIEFIRESLSKT